MIISSLCEYDKFLRAKDSSVFAPDGFAYEDNIKFLAILTPDGKIDNIISLGEKNGKVTLYPTMLLPRAIRKSSIFAYVADHRPEYLFGLEVKAGKFVLPKKLDKNSAFKKTTIEFFEDIDSPVAQAFYNFAKNWNPEEELENEQLLSIANGYSQSKFIFALSNRPDLLLHEDEKVKEKWKKFVLELDQNKEDVFGQCAVLGENLPIARVHDKIKKAGWKSTGCSLVCINNPSEESYGKSQSFNSNVSEKAMKEYVEALNFLLSDPKHNKSIDELTIVHFALTSEEEVYNSFINQSVFAETDDKPSALEAVKIMDDSLKETTTLISQGRKTALTPPDLEVEYCFFGIVPNVARLSIRFSYRNSFGELKRNIERYHEDFAIGNSTSAPAFWKIKRELVSPKSQKENLPPDVSESLFKAMLQGSPFAQKLLKMIIDRIKTDQNEENNKFIKTNDTRVGLVKACLNRKIKNEKEKITMALNTENKSPAYNCGRLFAVLEKIQTDSVDGKLNKTIADSYFSSAASTPALVLPKLVMLSQNHLSKLSEGGKVFYDKLCGEIIDNIADEFPKTLNLEEQGMFIVGYYQQKTQLYSKKEEN